MKEEIVRFQNVSVGILGDMYLDNMNFYMLKGEVMGFVASRDKGRGEFIELLHKNADIEYGRIFASGKQVNSYLHSPGTLNKVAFIAKQSSLIEDLSVTDNLFVIRKGFRKFVIKDQVLKRQMNILAKELGIRCNLEQNINQFSPLERCETELLKAYLTGCELIVLIDLSDFVGQVELELFYERIRQLKQRGMSFLYVCNHHEEAFRICDRVSLYSNGRIKKVFEKAEMTDQSIVPYIMNFSELSTKQKQKDRNKKIDFQNISTQHLKGISFHVKEGECLTLLDTDNRAVEELSDILAGNEFLISGQIIYDGEPIKPQKANVLLENKIAVIPENPTETYLFTELSYMENLTFLLDKKLGKMLIKNSYLKSIRKEYWELSMGGIDEMDIRKLSIRQKYGLVYYRVLLFHPSVVVLVRPVAHGDMVCRRYILELISMLKNVGITILILAGSISDNLYVSDRLVVIKEGNSVMEFNSDEFELITR